MKLRILNFILSFVFVLLLINISAADWIKGEFSEEAGIDSLERFMVIQDVDSNFLFGYKMIDMGDINSDSYTDLLIQRFYQSGHPNSKSFLFYGGNPPDSLFDLELPGLNHLIYDVGDINGDGFIDIGLFRYYGPGAGDADFYFGGANFDDSADFSIPNIYSYISKAADLDNDGIKDIALPRDMADSGKVNIYKIGIGRDTIPEYIICDTALAFGNKTATGFFNEDAYPDLAIAAYYNRDSSFIKFYWGGPDFDTIPDYEMYRLDGRFGYILQPIPDFNNDGYDDIFIAGSDDQNPYGIFFGGAVLDNEIDIVTNVAYGGSGYFAVSDVSSGFDINNDGYMDVMTGYSNDIAVYQEVKIFLGGPDADSIPDVYLENSYIPGGQLDMGKEVVGIADFNGDGIDDFVARSRTTGGCCWIGEVNFFAGWDYRGPCDCRPGNTNDDATINLFDITHIISYLYLDGPPPIPYELCSGDPNADCTCDIFDITYLIDYLYLSGPPPATCVEWRDACGELLRE